MAGNTRALIEACRDAATARDRPGAVLLRPAAAALPRAAPAPGAARGATLGVGVLVTRRWLLGHAEARRRAVVRDRGLPEGSLEWVVAMFTPSAGGKAPADDA